jgi:glucose-1-phosphate thymidylyltransferase
MWGIIPAAGVGSRIQPLAFSKELLPVGGRVDGNMERPRAVSEYIIERMIAGGTDKICFVISPGKSDIMEYYGGDIQGALLCYVIQPYAAGLCDSIFRAIPLISPEEDVVVGLPDTVWFPRDGLSSLSGGELSFLLFPVDRPDLFDAVLTAKDSRVTEIQVKKAGARSHWIWGAFKTNGAVLRKLHLLWCRRECTDIYVGDLINAYLAENGVVFGVHAGTAYVDVGTLDGYRQAMKLLNQESSFGEA